MTLSAYDHPLEVWSRDGTVVMVSVEYPGDDPELRALERELGKPDALLDWAQRTLVYAEAARVYAGRGIASLDSADGSTILRVNLFGVADAAGYAAKLHHPTRPMRRLPARQ